MNRRTLLALPLLAAPSVTRAQGFPSGPVRMLLPQAPGSSNDMVARIIQDPMSSALRQPVVVENRPGANGAVAINALKQARNDGQTILLTGVSQLAFNPHLYRTLPYDVARDFTMIAPCTDTPFVLITSKRSSITSLPALIEAAKQRDLSFSSAGNGNSTHLAMEMLCDRAGVRMTHVPYPGTAQGVTAVITGEVDAMIPTFGVAYPQIQSGAVNALAVVGTERVPQMPDLPTQAEAGLDAPVMPGWFAMVGVAGMPAPAVETLNAAIRGALGDETVQRRLRDQFLIPLQGSAAEMQARLDRESALWGEFIRRRNLTVG
ncbi:Bug family tripartite tricarboxylate transporter substrate binding protein [Sabulicella rubraurantiaca]|uniref:Bug family tripartite tricarboxylate transporter substrate binding protein n=1 Tax=Sabulicella rubraurantiaca TaxID=2811429 RepID=UPI001A95D5D8|nr:tripartite tricarboxylate transporter substrate binding protein [Sabulicella rubraurantiaca]